MGIIKLGKQYAVPDAYVPFDYRNIIMGDSMRDFKERFVVAPGDIKRLDGELEDENILSIIAGESGSGKTIDALCYVGENDLGVYLESTIFEHGKLEAWQKADEDNSVPAGQHQSKAKDRKQKKAKEDRNNHVSERLISAVCKAVHRQLVTGDKPRDLVSAPA